MPRIRKPFTIYQIWKYFDNKIASKVWSIILIIGLLFGIFFPYYLYYLDVIKGFSDIISIYSFTLALIASITAFVLYNYNSRDEESNYLELTLTSTIEDGNIKLRTEVFNPTKFDREIYFAFLLVTKTCIEEDGFIRTVNENFNTDFRITNSFNKLKYQKQIVRQNFGFYPLGYYYNENIRVGNEKLSFEKYLFLDNNSNENISEYEVRFFIYRNKNEVNNYHRSVCSSFVGKSILTE
jgi:hypothetical protein